MPEINPITREEKLWSGEDIESITREEMYIKHIYDKTQKIPSKPITRKEILLEKAGQGGGSDVTIKQLSVTANGTYSEENTAYSPVIVNVPKTPLSKLTVTENGTYTAPTGTGYDEVTVNVPLPDNAYLLKEVEGLPKDIATFTDGASLPMPSLKVGIDPIQDLHGYDNPWVGGAGKNKLQVTATTQTVKGVTYTVNDDGTIKASGTPQEQANLLVGYISLKVGTYIISGVPSAPSFQTFQMYIIANGNKYANLEGTQFTVSEDGQFPVYITVYGALSQPIEFKPMIRLASVTDATFEPYSNICPISGFTEANVVVSPLNISQLYNGQIYGDGTWVENSARLTNVQTAQSNVYFLKAGTYTLDYDKLNSNAPNLVQCSALTKDGSYTIIDNFANQWNSLPFTFTLTQDGYLYFTVRRNADTIINPSDYRVKILGHNYKVEFKDGSNPLTVYGGTLDVVSGELVVTYAKKALADISKIKYGNYQYGNKTVMNFFDSIPNSTLMKGMSNTFVLSVSGESYNVDKCSVVFSDGSSKTSILISTQASGLSADASVTEINEWLRSIDAYIVYPLATPQTYQLTSTQVNSLLGTNNVWADTGDIEELEYFSKEA